MGTERALQCPLNFKKFTTPFYCKDFVMSSSEERISKFTFLAIASLIFASKRSQGEKLCPLDRLNWFLNEHLHVKLERPLLCNCTLIPQKKIKLDVPHHINILWKNTFVDLAQWHKILNHVNDRTRRIRTRCLIRRQTIRISNKQIHIRCGNDNRHSLRKSQDRCLMKWCIVNKKHTSQ